MTRRAAEAVSASGLGANMEPSGAGELQPSRLLITDRDLAREWAVGAAGSRRALTLRAGNLPATQQAAARTRSGPALAGPAARSGPEVDGRLRVFCCAPELGDLAIADMVDVRHRDLQRLAPAGGGQRAQRDGVLVVGEHIMNIQPERAGCLLAQPGEETEDLVPAVVAAAQRPGSRHVP